ncbi:hypothetical protein JS562_34805, partial [Agrobacterium sp. S2]|nr:hypothetical protein [Agrobacterium sp. S2]
KKPTEISFMLIPRKGFIGSAFISSYSYRLRRHAIGRFHAGGDDAGELDLRKARAFLRRFTTKNVIYP